MDGFDILILFFGNCNRCNSICLRTSLSSNCDLLCSNYVFCWYAYSNNFWYCKVDKKL